MRERLHLMLLRLWRKGPGERRTAQVRTRFWAEVREGQREAEERRQKAPSPHVREERRGAENYCRSGRLSESSAGRFGRCRSPIHARAAMWLAAFSTESLRLSVHHWPAKVTIPTNA